MALIWLPCLSCVSADAQKKYVGFILASMYQLCISRCLHCKVIDLLFNTLRPRQNARHLPDDIFKCTFLNENVWISLKILLEFVPKVPINNIPALVLISEPMVVSLPTHICVTRPQWVNRFLNGLYYAKTNRRIAIDRTGKAWIALSSRSFQYRQWPCTQLWQYRQWPCIQFWQYRQWQCTQFWQYSDRAHSFGNTDNDRAQNFDSTDNDHAHNLDNTDNDHAHNFGNTENDRAHNFGNTDNDRAHNFGNTDNDRAHNFGNTDNDHAHNFGIYYKKHSGTRNYLADIIWMLMHKFHVIVRIKSPIPVSVQHPHKSTDPCFCAWLMFLRTTSKYWELLQTDEWQA